MRWAERPTRRIVYLLAGVAVSIALIGGALTTALMLAAGPTLYAAMGLTGRPVEMAVLYGAVMFGG